MSVLEALPAHAATGALASIARVACAGVFVALLATLGFALWRARKQIGDNETEAALESSFRELERELLLDSSRDREVAAAKQGES